uniref:PSI-F n=1 Tax=Trieres chinensis TaxID=1514140 RepID=A0A7S1Z753_TRICV|mmetsp:Transcript_19169/g.38868  ORF Transcript_19169/g.38868 Transcript_19169/m.38868 type:complete len:194 (+) Transcript_19169:167-748(+)
MARVAPSPAALAALAALLLTYLCPASAFVPLPASSAPLGSTALRAASKLTPPKFDKTAQKWEATCVEEGYGPLGSLLRFGPVPFLKRVSDSDAYEQAVLKYQAAERCDRMEAQGNMDAYFENPGDWTLQKMEEKKGGYKRDYTKIDAKKVALTLTWAVFVTSILVSIGNDVVSGSYCVENPQAPFCRVFFGTG